MSALHGYSWERGHPVRQVCTMRKGQGQAMGASVASEDPRVDLTGNREPLKACSRLETGGE